MEDILLIVISSLVAVGGGVAAYFFRKKATPKLPPAVETKRGPVALVPEPALPKEPELATRMGRTRAALSGSLKAFFGGVKPGAPDAAIWDQLEEILLTADVGLTTTRLLLDRVKAKVSGGEAGMIRDVLAQEAHTLFDSQESGFVWEGKPAPLVISMVGVNGVGKTTTTGKLAQLLKSQNKKVLMGAVDTFRAGAISQLKIWSERTGADFVTGREGADPGAVAFDAVTAGKARGVDVVLLDTAGRLHTKTDLMDELKKVHRVVKKVIPEAPHETWLVIDGTLGQNSIQQAKEFQKTLELTGVIVTKLDGTAKGGAVLAVAAELKLPVRYIGVGESAEELLVFESKRYVAAILGEAN